MQTKIGYKDSHHSHLDPNSGLRSGWSRNEDGQINSGHSGEDFHAGFFN